MPSPVRLRIAAGALVIFGLAILPAPLLPPHKLADALQRLFGIGWKWAYLVSAITLRALFYFAIGGLGALAVGKGSHTHRTLHWILLPSFLLALSLTIRSIKVGHLPSWVNVVIPAIACVAGSIIGIAILNGRWKAGLSVVLVTSVVGFAAVFQGESLPLRLATQAHLKNIVEIGERLPANDERFGLLLQAAFLPVPADGTSAVRGNRAAILAWGIAVGHNKLARLIGFDSRSDLVRRAEILANGTSVRGREDWSRHYALSAALAVLEHPRFSESAGLMKEELDALSQGTGFSFGDLAADRAGVRFAEVSTESEVSAAVMRERLTKPFKVDDFFPSISDFREDLTVEEFRKDFGGVGSKRFRVEIERIDSRIEACAGLGSPLPFR